MFPDAHATLDRLKELGVKLALITNGAAEPQRAKVVRFALEHRFDHIQIEGEHGFGKPGGARLYPRDGGSRRWTARDLDGRRQPRMGSGRPAAPRHPRGLARRLRRRPAARLADQARPHYPPDQRAVTPGRYCARFSPDRAYESSAPPRSWQEARAVNSAVVGNLPRRCSAALIGRGISAVAVCGCCCSAARQQSDGGQTAQRSVDHRRR